MGSKTRTLSLLNRFIGIRATTQELCSPLEIEDYGVQATPDGAPDASPPKWHLAHTTWFFETFLLSHLPHFVPYNPMYNALFNSYYHAVGQQWQRSRRGALSRPTVAEVQRYRTVVTANVVERIDEIATASDPATGIPLLDLLELGIHHEQQHQELLLMDIKAILGLNPLFPAYRHKETNPKDPLGSPNFYFITGPQGLRRIGHADDARFAFDNERPWHEVNLGQYRIADHLVTCGDYLAFMEDGGYSRPELWLDDGWNAIHAKAWRAPLYWHADGEDWFVFTLHGLKPLDRYEPVCHVSFFEADAFARWFGVRLPREEELEITHTRTPTDTQKQFLEGGEFHPQPSEILPKNSDLCGVLWQWSSSAYRPYPGYKTPRGATGEYNGKFMNNQYALRGGSFATPRSHYRHTYRNFYPPDRRWMFSGIRLAKDF